MQKILIIDDEEPILRHLKQLLQLLDYEALTASNGAEGLKIAQNPEVSMMISDLCMPGDPSELDLIRALREARPELPLVVISGYPTSDILGECEKLGVTDFLTKPFELSFISSIIEKAIGRGGPA